MIIASIIKNEKQKGDHLLQMSKEECQIMAQVFGSYCIANKRMKKAKKMLKELEDNLQIW